jgi:hypothetical protein
VDDCVQGYWSKEEVERLKELHAQKGDRWKELGAALGRLPEAVRDKFKMLKLGDARRSGKWSPEEEAKLIELVNQHMENRVRWQYVHLGHIQSPDTVVLSSEIVGLKVGEAKLIERVNQHMENRKRGRNAHLMGIIP